MTEVENLRSKKKSLIAEYLSVVSQDILIPVAGVPPSIMVVCEVCGSILCATDSEDRIVTHVTAKLHSGVLAINKKINQLQV